MRETAAASDRSLETLQLQEGGAMSRQVGGGACACHFRGHFLFQTKWEGLQRVCLGGANGGEGEEGGDEENGINGIK